MELTVLLLLWVWLSEKPFLWNITNEKSNLKIIFHHYVSKCIFSNKWLLVPFDSNFELAPQMFFFSIHSSDRTSTSLNLAIKVHQDAFQTGTKLSDFETYDDMLLFRRTFFSDSQMLETLFTKWMITASSLYSFFHFPSCSFSAWSITSEEIMLFWASPFAFILCSKCCLVEQEMKVADLC